MQINAKTNEYDLSVIRRLSPTLEANSKSHGKLLKARLEACLTDFRWALSQIREYSLIKCDLNGVFEANWFQTGY